MLASGIIGFLGLITSIIWLIVAFTKKRPKRNPAIILIICWLLMIIGCARTKETPYEDGVEAYNKHDYKQAIAKLKEVPPKDRADYAKAQEMLEKIPGEASEYWYLEALALEDRRLREAKASLEKALKWDPENKEAGELLETVTERVAERDAKKGIDAYEKEDFESAIKWLGYIPKEYEDYTKVQKLLEISEIAAYIINNGEAYYAMSDISVRSGPGIKHRKIGKLKLGDKIKGIKEKKDWISILRKREIGYVHEPLLTTDNRVARLESVPLEQGIAQIGAEIVKYQKSVVWSGGTPEYGCYTWVDRNRFLSTGNGIQRIVNKAKGNTNFIEAVIALKAVSQQRLDALFRNWRRPVYKTWAMIGRICPEGTTNAGYQTQGDIAEALVTLVEELLKSPTEEIVRVWLSYTPY